MDKRGQLGTIELKFFLYGMFVGLPAGFALVFLGTVKILPFSVPFVCPGLVKFMDKKGQLGWIEFQYFLGGLAFGFVAALVLTFLGTAGILPFQIPLVCPAAPAAR